VVSSAILRASGDTFIFRISAVLAGVLLIVFLRLVAMGQLFSFFVSKETPLGCSSAMTVPTGTFVPS
jgi:hypothetical protein